MIETGKEDQSKNSSKKREDDMNIRELRGEPSRLPAKNRQIRRESPMSDAGQGYERRVLETSR